MEQMPQPNNTPSDTNRKVKLEEVLDLLFNSLLPGLVKPIQIEAERKYEREEESSREWNKYWKERQESTKRYERDILESYQALGEDNKCHWENIVEVNKGILSDIHELHGLHEELRRERNKHEEDRRERWCRMKDLEERLHAANRTIQMLEERHPEDEKDILKTKGDTPDK